MRKIFARLIAGSGGHRARHHKAKLRAQRPGRLNISIAKRFGKLV